MHCGVTLQKYVLQMRLDRAYREVILTDRRFEEIAEELGYTSLSHFSQLFKAHFGMTPSGMRKTVQMRTV
jgi:AraC family transcriptional regulator